MTFGVCGVIIVSAMVVAGAVAAGVTYALKSGDKSWEGAVEAIKWGAVGGAAGVVLGTVAGAIGSRIGSSFGPKVASGGDQALASGGKGSASASAVGSTLSQADLNAAQLANYTRYLKKLPAGAEETTITRGAANTVEFTTNVPGRVPGSYATYTKTVDQSGTTIGYTKTTVAPDGSVVHIKDKMVQ